jgi:hypothetical protein
MICEYCHNRPATDKHHLFSQTKWARALYGKLIDHPRNIMMLCNDCHLTKPIPKFTEREFCDALEIMPRSKTENMLARG